MPSELAYDVGSRLADALLASGETIPETVGIVVWGTAAMRTHGDDVAEVLALLGVRPRWNRESRRITGLEVLSLEELGRPRIDVTVRLSGFFRDAFPGVIAMLDEAVRTVAELDEPPEQNFVRKHVLEELAQLGDGDGAGDPAAAMRRATTRLFGPRPGAYGAGLLQLLETRAWRDTADLAAVFEAWSGHAYGRGLDGAPAPEAMRAAFARIDVAVKNVDTREHDIFDSDDYFQEHGGMVAMVRHLTGKDPRAAIGDSADPSNVRSRPLQEEARRVFRSRVANPRWIASMVRHGYKGAFELSATVDYLFGYDATTGVVEDWMYEQLASRYALDADLTEFLRRSNPWALQAICERLLEAADRGLWQAPSDGVLDALREQWASVERRAGGRGGMSAATSRPGFPLSALVGSEALREALLVCAVDPAIGGVLVRGERGTAKTTAVRALAALLPAVEVVAGCPLACEPAACSCPEGGGEAVRRPVRLVELPVGATQDRVTGALDVGRALRDGEAQFSPGVLAEAHRGVLYVDEVNLLADHLVDVLLDAAATGVNRVERDGLSVEHAARFLLVGTMNPEEGDLRPQLLDRFGIAVEVGAPQDPRLRAEVVRRRMRFDADPAAFAAAHAQDEDALRARVLAARDLLPSVVLSDGALDAIARVCARLGVDGLRADLACARAARALAALDGDDHVTLDHVGRAAVLALAHRRRRGPLERGGVDPEAIRQALEEPPEDDGPDGGSRSDAQHGGQTPGVAAGAHQEGQTAGAHQEGQTAGAHQAGQTPAPQPAPAPDRTADPAGAAVPPPSLDDARRRLRQDGPAGRRARRLTADGRPVRDRSLEPGDRVAVLPTVLHAARHGRAAPVAADLRGAVCEARAATTVVFCVDASGSLGARRRMAQVKDAALAVLTDAYVKRDRVALVTFRDTGAGVLLEPTSSVELAAERLRRLPTGGRTPLAAGLHAAHAVARAETRRDPDRRVLVLLVTDGRANDGAGAAERALHAARALTAHAALTVMDAEAGPVRLGGAARLAAAAGVPVLPLVPNSEAA